MPRCTALTGRHGRATRLDVFPRFCQEAVEQRRCRERVRGRSVALKRCLVTAVAPNLINSHGLVTSLVPNPIKFTWLGDIHDPTPYKFIGFGDIRGPKPYTFGVDPGCFLKASLLATTSAALRLETPSPGMAMGCAAMPGFHVDEVVAHFASILLVLGEAKLGT